MLSNAMIRPTVILPRSSIDHQRILFICDTNVIETQNVLCCFYTVQVILKRNRAITQITSGNSFWITGKSDKYFDFGLTGMEPVVSSWYLGCSCLLYPFFCTNFLDVGIWGWGNTFINYKQKKSVSSASFWIAIA